MESKKIDYKSEFNSVSNHSREMLETKYKDLLLLSSKYENKIKNQAQEIEKLSNTQRSSNKGVHLSKEELNKIKSSLEEKTKIAKVVINKLGEKEKEISALKEEKELIISSYQNNIKLLESSLEKQQKKFVNILDSKIDLLINRDNDSTKIEDEFKKIEQSKQDFDLKKSLLELKKELDATLKINESLTKELEESRNKNSLFSKIDEENFLLIKELSLILKSSNFDEDLIKRLKKQIKINMDLSKKNTLLKEENHKLKTSSHGHNKTNITHTLNRNKEIASEGRIEKRLLDFLKSTIPVIELFRQTVSIDINESFSNEFKNWISGFRMIYNKFEEIILLFSIEIISPNVKDKFDPQIHESINLGNEEGFIKDQIITLQERGYRYDKYLIKPAKVKVQI